MIESPAHILPFAARSYGDKLALHGPHAAQDGGRRLLDPRLPHGAARHLQ